MPTMTGPPLLLDDNEPTTPLHLALKTTYLPTTRRMILPSRKAIHLQIDRLVAYNFNLTRS